MHSVVVHCHFYQPPRDNPWSEVVEAEPAAAPFLDWNARITHECYAPFGAARILDPAGHITGSLNLYEWVSFDAAPTLLRWMETNAADVYHTILAADRASERRTHHGNAIATPFHHVILPLASRRDKVTEVRWGLADFRRRFGRDAEGFWLPETAVDEETLVVLAEERIRFTILAPHQLENAARDGGPLRFDAGGGRSVAVFVYDGGISGDAAFGRLLDDGEALVVRLAPSRESDASYDGPGGVTSLALDGETFGHHRKFAEMALSSALTLLQQLPTVRVENYAAVLARTPPAAAVRLVEPSSWSCPHGIERWRSDCSCGIVAGRSHAWRRPLRAALNWLARELDARYAAEAEQALRDASAARAAYGGVAGASRAERAAFASTQARGPRDADRARVLLDGVRARLGMFSSCAWFFDDVGGHETALMLRLAAYALDALGTPDLEREFLARLADARTDDPALEDGATVYRTRVVPLRASGGA